MSFRPHAIEIDGGVVRWATRESASGTWIDWPAIGAFHFLVDLLEEDGGRIGLWSGTDYAQAIAEAESARLDFDVEEPVRDRIGGGS
jgi:hypothetical protein